MKKWITILLLLVCSLCLTSCGGFLKRELHPLTKEQIMWRADLDLKEGDYPEHHQVKSEKSKLLWVKEVKDFVDEALALDIAVTIVQNLDAGYFEEPIVYSNTYQERNDAYSVYFEHDNAEKKDGLEVLVSRQNGAVIVPKNEKSIIENIDKSAALDIAVAAVANRYSNENYIDQTTFYYNSYREDMDAYFVCFYHGGTMLEADMNVIISRKNGEILVYGGDIS